jgi:hypothetical protein
MFENLFKNPEVRNLKYFMAFIAICICMYAYAGATGWKYFGTNTEKWSPDGASGHQHSGGARRHYHK